MGTLERFPRWSGIAEGHSTPVCGVRLDARDVGGEKADSVSIEVAAGAVVVLGGARVGVAGEDLRVAEWHAGVEGVGDGGVAQ